MHVHILRLFRFLLVMVALPLVLVGCFHSDNNENPVPASERLSGTVATGAPVAGFVYVKDKNGNEVNVAIGSNGGYSISVSGMSAPFMVRAVPTSGDTLYSYAAAANVTANITPLTMLALFLGHNQGDLAALYGAWASNFGTLTTAKIQAAQATINANFAARMQAAGLDANSYDFLTTVFTANSTGIDAVLDGIRINVNPTAGNFAVTAADGTSVSFNLAIDASAITIGGTKGSSGGSGGSSSGPCSSGWCLAVSGTVTTNGVAVTIPPVAAVSGLPDSAVPTSSNSGGIDQSIQDAYGATGTVSNLVWTIISSSATEVVAHLTFNVAVTSPVALTYAYDLTYTYTKASGSAGSGSGVGSGSGGGNTGGATLTWASRTSGTTDGLSKIVWSGTQFVAVGGPGTIRTSSDGITWASRTSGTTSTIYNIAWSGTQFVIVGQSGMIRTSSDGITWTSRTSGTPNTLFNVVWSGTQFVAVGESGTIRTSSDGITWTSRASGTTDRLDHIVWSGTQFVALGSVAIVGSPATILTSPDGVTWTSRTSGTTKRLTGIVWSGTQFVAVGETGTILTSPDGISWTSQTSGTTTEFFSVAWSGAQFVAVGYVGTILTSPDGISWTSRTSGTGAYLDTIIWSGTQFVIVGGSGTILASSDGVTWASQTSGTTESLYDIAWSGTQFVAVGGPGTILTGQ